LTAGTIRYPVVAVNDTVQLLDSDPSTNETVQITSYGIEVGESGFFGSTIGGISLVAQNLYDGAGSLYFGERFQIQGNGTFPFIYFDTNNGTDWGSCNMIWSDPTSDILAGIQELML
jgi:hypothetical protein